MRYFNKLGTVDRLHRSSSTNELEEMALSEVIKFDTADRYVHWNDIAGLKFAKETLREAIVLPRIIPQIFNTLLRAPPLGVLLFGRRFIICSLNPNRAAIEHVLTFFFSYFFLLLICSHLLDFLDLLYHYLLYHHHCHLLRH